MFYSFLYKSVPGILLIKIRDGKLVYCKWSDKINDASPCQHNEDSDKANTGLAKLVCTQLDEYFRGERRHFSIPMESEGTYFQKKVWEEMTKIPYGKTVSYGELAANIGNPRAVRAVANACGVNPLPILVPCHRVIAANGKIGGYTGGLDKKVFLLKLESHSLDNK